MTIKIKINGATLIDAKNPRWMDEEKTSIVLECKFSHYADLGLTENDGYYEFGATPDDVEEHGRQIFEKAKAGDYGTVGDYVAPEDPPSEG